MNYRFKSSDPNNITAIIGVLTCATIGYGLLVSFSHYSGPGFYSPRNHFISELGTPEASPMSNVFNHCLMLGGILMLAFNFGLANFFGKGRIVKIAAFIGVIAALSFSTIGYYPADDWPHHVVAAKIFFTGAMISIGLFCYTSWQNSERGFHRYINYLGLHVAILYLIVLVWPKETLNQYVYDFRNFSRPSFWALPILEWSYCLLICFWIISISANLLYLRHRQKAIDPGQ